MTDKHTELPLNATISVSNDAVCVEMDDERVALNMINNHYFDINDIGSLIWGMIEEQSLTIEQLCQQLYDQFSDDDPAIIQADVIDFLANGQQQGILTIDPPTTKER